MLISILNEKYLKLIFNLFKRVEWFLLKLKYIFVKINVENEQKYSLCNYEQEENRFKF
jgi:hypothetical protein